MTQYWLKVTTFEEFQQALDGHRLWIVENWKGGPRWYLVRRNGATKRWLKKSNSHRWEIPIKYKLNVCLRIGHDNFDMWKDRFKAGVGPDHETHWQNTCDLNDEQSKAYFERYVAGDRK